MSSTKLPIPASVLEQHIALLGKTRSGKSSTARLLVEHLLDHKKPVCIIDPKGDWYGLKSSANGKDPGYPLVIFGGEHADVAINEHSGAHVAELIATGNRPCIIDLGGWMVRERTRFFIDFASTLFKLARGQRWLMIDEVHNFAPKGKVFDVEAGKCLHWANRLASEGAGKGILLIGASQRPQKVHNDFLTSCETLIAKRVIHPSDRQAISDWINGCGDPGRGAEVLSSLAGIKREQGWVWSPEIGFGPELVTFPLFKTYDSFKAQPGEAVKLKGWAEVDLQDVREKLIAVVKEAEANDPRALKAKVAELTKQHAALTKQLAAQKPASGDDGGKGNARVAEAIKKVVEQRDAWWVKHLRGVALRVRDLKSIVAKQADYILKASGGREVLDAQLDGFAEALLHRTSAEAQETTTRLASAVAEVRPPPGPAAPQTANVSMYRTSIHSSAGAGGGGNGGNGERVGDGAASRVLAILAQYPDGVEDRLLAARAGVSRKKSTYRNALTDLRKRGFMVDGPGKRRLTPAGFEAAKDVPPLPTGAALLDHYRAQLGQGAARQIFEVLVKAHPSAVLRGELADQAGVDPGTSTFRNALTDLRAWELFDGRDELRLAPAIAEALEG